MGVWDLRFFTQVYLTGWKEALPAGEVHALLTGRETLQSTRYMYLADWKGNPPVKEVHVPC
jgi:hypothetical protein